MSLIFKLFFLKIFSMTRCMHCFNGGTEINLLRLKQQTISQRSLVTLPFQKSRSLFLDSRLSLVITISFPPFSPTKVDGNFSLPIGDLRTWKSFDRLLSGCDRMNDLFPKQSVHLLFIINSSEIPTLNWLDRGRYLCTSEMRLHFMWPNLLPGSA